MNANPRQADHLPADALIPLASEYVLGILDASLMETYQEMLATIPTLNRFTTELNDTLACAVAASIPLRKPPTHLRDRILSEVNSIPAIVTTDRNGKIIGLNTAFTALCGYTLSEVKGKRPGEFLQGPLTDPRDAAELGRSVREGIGITREIVNYHKSGKPYRVLIRINPVFDDSGSVVGFTAVERKIGDVAVAA